MNKTLLAVVIVVIIAAAAYAVYHSSQNSSSNSSTGLYGSSTPTPTDTPAATPSSSPTATNTTGDLTAAAVISDYTYSPQTLTVKTGTKVTWTNKDNVGHSVSSDSGPDSFNSSLMSNGQSFSFTFTKAGTYTYHCSQHTYMTGTVVVTD